MTYNILYLFTIATVWTYKAKVTHTLDQKMDKFTPPMEQNSEVLSVAGDYETETDEVSESKKVIIEYTPSSQDVLDSTSPIKSEGGSMLTDIKEEASASGLVEFSPPAPESSLSSDSDANTTFGSTDSDNLDIGSTDYIERVTKRKQKSLQAFFAKKSKRNNNKENKTDKKVTFSDKIEEVNYAPKEVTPEKGNNLSDIESLNKHFEGNLQLRDIPRWTNNQTFINQVSKCPIPPNEHCETCEKLLFSIKIRGYPLKPVNWYKDSVMDSTNPYYVNKRQGDGDIIQKFEKHCLRQEKLLRAISRQEVFEALLARFRGYYTRGDDDCINFIENCYNWDDLEDYLDWKNEWDEMYHEEWMISSKTSLFCTGCGVKCHLKNKKSWPNDPYQVCALNKCNFYHDNSKEYARVKGENEFRISSYYKSGYIIR